MINFPFPDVCVTDRDKELFIRCAVSNATNPMNEYSRGTAQSAGLAWVAWIGKAVVAFCNAKEEKSDLCFSTVVPACCEFLHQVVVGNER